MGYIEDYEEFLSELDKVWQSCYDALVPGGRLVCVVGDVCLSRRKNNGEHVVVPLHASIQEHCRAIGYNNLAPIIWHKIANAAYEASGNGGGFLGKPYEPNAVIKNDIEFILMERKPGGYRSPSLATRHTQRRSRRAPQSLVSTDLDWRYRGLHKESSGAVSAGACRAAGAHVLVCRRHGAGPVSGHGNHQCRSGKMGPEQHRCRSRPALFPDGGKARQP